jgi:hypothetical protein
VALNRNVGTMTYTASGEPNRISGTVWINTSVALSRNAGTAHVVHRERGATQERWQPL